MKSDPADMAALAHALETFSQTTRTMEEAYRRLEARVAELDAELADKNQRLAYNTEYLTSLLESMSDGVIAVDLDGAVTRFNRAASLILGYDAAEVTGRPFHDEFGRDFAAPRMPGETELRAKSGRMVPVIERDSPITGGSGQRLGSVKTFQDLSELIALREQVRQIDRLAAIGEMAATVAHEIRNPLGGIRGFATFLADDIKPEDPRRRLVDKILEGVQSLERVVNELLEYTRPVDLSLRPAPCAGIVQAALGFLKYDSRQISIMTEIDPRHRVLADAGKMRQVFLNILLNAVQSIEGRGEILVSAAADANTVTVAFRDSGCGIAAEQLGQIFSPFFTTKEKGTGLGLAVCAKVVEGHGGEIRAESELGRGSTISVRLPRAE
jgi:PAS domain S-box-containing protein